MYNVLCYHSSHEARNGEHRKPKFHRKRGFDYIVALTQFKIFDCYLFWAMI